METYSTLCRQRSSQRPQIPVIANHDCLTWLQFYFYVRKGSYSNYIDLRSVLAIDRSQGCTMNWYSYHTATYYKWPNLCFDRNPNMSPVHPQGGRRPNFGQPVPCPTPGRIDRNSTVVFVDWSFCGISHITLLPFGESRSVLNDTSVLRWQNLIWAVTFPDLQFGMLRRVTRGRRKMKVLSWFRTCTMIRFAERDGLMWTLIVWSVTCDCGSLTGAELIRRTFTDSAISLQKLAHWTWNFDYRLLIY